MKISRDGNTRLEVVNTYFLLPGVLALLGAGLLAQELPKFLRGQQHLADFNSDVPLFVGGVFLIIGALLCSRFSVSIDKSRGQLTWKWTRLLASKTRLVPLHAIKGAGFETDPSTNVQSHPQWGPKVRLIIATTEGALPLAPLYTYRSASTTKAFEEINAFLGIAPKETELAPSGDDADVRALVAQGKPIAAIALVRERRRCSLREAKDIVDAMR
jgi:hypothetical protein